jgi:hypothetical protein
MRRREFITLAGASVTWPFAALAQEPGRTYRLGLLLPRSRDAPVNVAFLDELRRRGFIDGQNKTGAGGAGVGRGAFWWGPWRPGKTALSGGKYPHQRPPLRR